MKRNFSRRCSVGAVLAVAVTALGLAANPAIVNAQQPVARELQGKTAGQAYKNVKVLKDLPGIELHPTMEYMTVALGVACGYCHVPRKPEADDKPTKRTARNMMQMEFALNNTVFAGKREVTCYTCHRGAPIGAADQLLPDEKAPTEPPSPDSFANNAISNLTLDSSMAPARPGPGDPPPAAAPANAPKPSPVALPSVDDVLAKYQQAIGGAAAVHKAGTLVEKGTVEMELPNPPDVQGPLAIGHPAVEVYRKAPDKAAEIIQTPMVASLQGYDGASGWLAGLVDRELVAGELKVFQNWAEFVPGWNFQDNHTNVRVIAREKIAGHDAYVISGMAKNGSGWDRLYFDAQSGLLVRSVTNMNTVLGSFPIMTNFDDYRDVSGVKVAATVHVLRPKEEKLYKFDQIEINAPVQDARFQEPPRPAAPPAAAPRAAGTPPAQ